MHLVAVMEYYYTLTFCNYANYILFNGKRNKIVTVEITL
jgi:hypothetical protein